MRIASTAKLWQCDLEVKRIMSEIHSKHTPRFLQPQVNVLCIITVSR